MKGTRMRTSHMNKGKSYLIEILTTLAENEVEFVICGGMAAVYHGVERMTMDMDISLDMSTGNVKKFLLAVKELGLIPRAPVPPESLLDKKMIDFFIKDKKAIVFTFWHPDNPYNQIDIFLTDDKSYNKLKNHTVIAKIENKNVKIISIEKLLEMKLAINPPREKDKLDIAELKKIMRIV
jgi:hypothetical protein